MNRHKRVARLEGIDIYPVTCQALSEGRTNVEILDGILAGGARIIQLREKEWSKRRLYEMAMEFRVRTSRCGVILIINDHVDVALAVQADGVHLGREDLPVSAARAVAPDLIFGVSCHSLGQALQAEKEGADYVNIGPVFSTQTKEGVGKSLGPDAIRDIGPKLRIPFTTMGGITRENIHEVLEAGARSVAMVTGITRAPDVKDRVMELREIIHSYRERR